MVNEHANRDSADWQAERLPDRRPGKKPRLSDPAGEPDDYNYRSRSAPSQDREYEQRERHRDYDHRDRSDPRDRQDPRDRPDPRERSDSRDRDLRDDHRTESRQDLRDDPHDHRDDPRDLRDDPRGPPPPMPPASGDMPPPEGSPSAGVGVRLLLANLSYNTTEDQIIDFFRDAGAEVASVKLVRVSNRVNGNAYVWMQDERSVDIALELDGREFLGRTLRVSSMPEDQRTACVRGLPPRSTDADVEDLFRGCKILDIRCRPVKGGPPDMNTWFVDFADEKSFSHALAKDRTQPGLMICIATAQGRGPRTPRDKSGGPPSGGRDDMDRPMPMPMRDEYDRGAPSRRDEYERPSRSRDGFEKRPEERDMYERKGPSSSHDFEDQERTPGKDRNGVNGAPSSRGRSRSRSRSPQRGYERGRGGDRYHDDRMRGDRRMDYDRRYSRDRDRRHSPGRDDRYGDRGYDRDDDRDRRDYRRDYDRWGDRDRDYRRDRDRRRDYDRDYGRMDRRGGRYDRDGPDSRYREAHDRRDHPLDPSITTVLTNLPFCEDREHVINTLGNTLTDLSEHLHVKEIIPVGRRCGAAIVIFRDEEAKAHAVGMQSITIMSRKVNILPLEVPSVARVQKLLPGFSVNEILDDMQRHYGVESLFVKLKQSDQLLLGVEDTRYLVRLLDIDGRPLLSSRYATVSYIPSRQYSDSLAGRSRRPPNEFDDPNGRGNERDRGYRDDRDSPGNDRRRSDMGPGDRRESGEQRPGGDNDSRGYQHSATEWKLRLDGIPPEMTKKELQSGFDRPSLSGISLVKEGNTPIAFVYGGQTGQQEMEEVIALYNDKKFAPFKYTTQPAVIIRDTRKRAVPGEPIDDTDGHPPSPKKFRSATEDDWKAKTNATPLSSSCSRAFRVSPMTPSPADDGMHLKKQLIDSNLPETCRRLERLRPTIMEGSSLQDDDDNYALFCESLSDFCEPQKLIHTTANNIDQAPPQIWTGNIKKGSSPAAFCQGYLVLNSSQSDEQVRKTVNEMPKEISIERRVSWSHESFSHLLTPDAVVTVLKAADEDIDASPGRQLDKNGMHTNPSRAALNGILKSLRGKQCMGLYRYVQSETEKKYVALCIPPNPYVFEKLRVPWRFRDFAGHDSLLLIVGPKNQER